MIAKTRAEILFKVNTKLFAQNYFMYLAGFYFPLALQITIHTDFP